MAVVGGSGAGKTWLAQRLCEYLAPHAIRLSLDDFYRDRSHLTPQRRTKLNFDHPRAIDWTILARVLSELSAGRAVERPAYDFATHCRQPSGIRTPARRIVIVDGLWLLRQRALRRVWDVGIYVDCAMRTRLQRRLARDVSSRGRTETSVRAQFRATVEPMHLKFVEPQARWADHVLKGTCGKAEIKHLAVSLRQRAGLQES